MIVSTHGKRDINDKYLTSHIKQRVYRILWHPILGCLHDFLPPEPDHSVSHRLRHSTVYPIPQVRTKRYCSFINYSIKYYQWQLLYVRNSAIYFTFYVYMLYILVPLFSCNFHLYSIIVCVYTSVSINVIFIVYFICNQSSLMATRF